MNCKIFQTEIKESDRGAPLGLAAREHLDDCAACRKIHDEQTTLRILIGELEKVAAPADFDVHLRSRIAAVERSEKGFFTGRLSFSPSTVSVALAAAFVLGSLLVVRLGLSEKAMTTDPAPPAAGKATINPVVASSPTAGQPVASSGDFVAGKAAAASQPAAAYAHNPTIHRRVTVASRAGAARSVAAPPLVEAASDTDTMDLKGASVLSAGTSAAVAISVSGGVEPVSLIFRNERGESQKVSLKPVSFGAQQLVGRPNFAARNTSAGRDGVW